MTKKIIVFLLVALLSVAYITVSAAELPTLTSSAYLSEEENTVELTISISENTKICGCSFTIIYDNSKLKYNSYVAEDIIKNTSLIVNEKYAENSIRVAWAAIEELTAGGDVISVKFDLLERAEGTTELQIDKAKMVDVNGSKIECSSENVLVLISESDEMEDENPSDETNGSDDNSTGNGSTSSGGSSTSGSSSSGGSSLSSGGSSKPKPDENQDDNYDEIMEPLPETPTEETEEDYEVFLLGFDDVKETDWFYESVKFVKERGYMSGVGESEFAPNSTLTRAMLVTILYRLENSPECGNSPFTDVKNDTWYSKGVAWAAETGIVNGVGKGLFAPNNNITREQIAVILYNYAKTHDLDISHYDELNGFKDVSEVSEWASDAVHWAVGANLISGKGEGLLDARGNATRAELATILKRFTENM